ncbi:hypothetical protein DFJ74DRAFT_672909 [Hyaloraphidium curvatum]|nr:hypothetical protein DFJ74DRAFT_672909 [Hyaloraphidium curvatum]
MDQGGDAPDDASEEGSDYSDYGPLTVEQATPRFESAKAAARAGERGDLVSILTDSQYPAEFGKSVLADAKNGEPWAQVAVGAVYDLGMADREGTLVATKPESWGWLPGVEDPAAEGRAWMEKAAESGWAPAAIDFGLNLRFEEPDLGLVWLKKGLEKEGELSKKTAKMARKWVARLLEDADAPWEEQFAVRTQLADGGDEESVKWFGDRYRLGEGVEADLEKAKELYEKAAGAGSPGASTELAKMLEDVDDARAKELYEFAAEMAGDRYARTRLADKYGEEFYRVGEDEPDEEYY